MPPAVALLNYISSGKRLADFYSKLGHFVGFFYILFAGRNSEAVMGRGREGVGGHNMINMTIRELYCTFADLF